MQVIITNGGQTPDRPGTCVPRAITIASGLPYAEVYDELEKRRIAFSQKSRSRVAKIIVKMVEGKIKKKSGHYKAYYHDYILSLGFVWVATMAIGQGCKVHLREGELPTGRIIARVSRHLCAVIDGVIHDTHDPSRGGTRCVYGYYQKIN